MLKHQALYTLYQSIIDNKPDVMSLVTLLTSYRSDQLFHSCPEDLQDGLERICYGLTRFKDINISIQSNKYTYDRLALNQPYIELTDRKCLLDSWIWGTEREGRFEVLYYAKKPTKEDVKYNSTILNATYGVSQREDYEDN